MIEDCPAPPATERPRYHHGALHDALLVAAEAELADSGLEGFSLRRVAKRAGVSHAAPAHHFGDANGLLTALAAEGFRRFVAAMTAREAKADPGPKAQLVAAGLGYIDFAAARPTLFRLMFSSGRPDFTSADLADESGMAFGHLQHLVATLTGDLHPVDVTAAWATAHGLADLMAAGRMGALARLDPDERERAFATIIARSVPD